MASGKSLQTTSDRANMRFHLAQIRNHVLDDVREGIGIHIHCDIAVSVGQYETSSPLAKGL